MKRKAIIFPYNAECASLVRNRELLLNHEIVACVSPIGYGLQGKDRVRVCRMSLGRDYAIRNFLSR